MYNHPPVKVPDVKGKLIFRKTGASTYVHYETGRVYDPKKKYNSPARVTIGKLVDENDRTLMYPNEKFWEHFPLAAATAMLEPPKVRSNTLKAGARIVFEKIAKDCGLDRCLKKIFEDEGGLILDLACCVALYEDNACKVYPEYARCHPLFVSDMLVLGPRMRLKFLSHISEDDIRSFLYFWQEQQKPAKKIYIPLGRGILRGDCAESEFKDPMNTCSSEPCAGIIAGFIEDNQIPLFYEEFPLFIDDFAKIRLLCSMAEERDWPPPCFILDGSLVSRQIMQYLDDKNLNFMLRLESGSDLVKELVSKHCNAFEDDYDFKIKDVPVQGMTVRRGLFKGDPQKRYVHLFFDDAKKGAVCQEFYWHVDPMDEELKRLEGLECTVEGPETRFFNIMYEEEPGKKIFRRACKKSSAINAEVKQAGYFCLASSEKMTAQQAYDLYHGHERSCLPFKFKAYDHEYMPSLKVRASLHFIDFVAMITRCRFYNLLKKSRAPELRHMSVREALSELEKIEMTRKNERGYAMDFALTARQESLLEAFGISPEDVAVKIQELSAQLNGCDDENIIELPEYGLRF